MNVFIRLHGSNATKSITFPITDEMAEHMKALFANRNQGSDNDEMSFECEGGKSIKVEMSVIDSKGKF